MSARDESVYSTDAIPRFTDPDLEKSFQKFHVLLSQYQIRLNMVFYSTIQILLLLSEGLGNTPTFAKRYLFIFRIAIVLILCTGLLFVSLESFTCYVPNILRIVYSMVALMLLGMYTTVSLSYDLHDEALHSGYIFYLGIWSNADSLYFVFTAFNCSGMLLGDAATVSALHIFLCIMLPFLIFGRHTDMSDMMTGEIILLPLLHCFEMLYMHFNETESRQRYLGQIEAGRDLCRQDKLIHSILPRQISVSLKEGKTEQLASFYSSVTVLFCYIVDFTSKSLTHNSKDVVSVVQRVVNALDHIVDQTGAYKVENIADTYMACAGCPEENSRHPIIIAQTAIAMMEASQKFSWRWPDGTPVVLKIGIHSGSITAGVIGTKSYSYHLFGDTVNTASRMCSHSTSGKILLSHIAFKKLTMRAGDMFDLEERGEVKVKGKGNMKLHWLNGYKPNQKGKHLVNFERQPTKRVYTDRYAQLRESQNSKVVISPITLRFRPYFSKDTPHVPAKSKAARRHSSAGILRAEAVSSGLRRLISGEVRMHPIIENDSRRPSDNAISSRVASSLQSTQTSFGASTKSLVSRQNTVLGEYISAKLKAVKEEGTKVVVSEKDRIDGIVRNVESNYKQEFDGKSIVPQRHTLGVVIVCTLVYFFHQKVIAGEYEVEHLVNAVLCIIVVVMSKFWTGFSAYSQKIVVTLIFLLVINYKLQNRTSELQVNGPSLRMHSVLFTVLFMRLRFHYVIVFSVVIPLFSVLVVFLGGNAILIGVDIRLTIYTVGTLFVATWLRYIQEYASRSEYADIFALESEKLKSQELLSNMLPSPQHALKLLHGNFISDDLEDVTLLYSDMKGFTPLSAKMHPLELCQLLNDVYSSFDRHLNYFGLYKVDIIGDAFVVVGGLPCHTQRSNSALNCVLFAFHMLEDVKNIREKYGVDIQLRVGIHSGNAVGSVVSLNKPRYLLWGAASMTANYMESSGVPGHVNISEETMEKLQPRELDILNIQYVQNIIDNAEESERYTKCSYLLSCDDVSDFYHPSEHLDNEIYDEPKTSYSLFASAISQLKRLSGTKKAQSEGSEENSSGRLIMGDGPRTTTSLRVSILSRTNSSDDDSVCSEKLRSNGKPLGPSISARFTGRKRSCTFPAECSSMDDSSPVSNSGKNSFFSPSKRCQFSDCMYFMICGDVFKFYCSFENRKK
mmetsp:Transcript_18424/g.26801  ORF Transcript_18424/g.26801 Transcript_18424/m.26801 type:complete len:1185 (-) Transcript_18424:412-3966(-)